MENIEFLLQNEEKIIPISSKHIGLIIWVTLKQKDTIESKNKTINKLFGLLVFFIIITLYLLFEITYRVQ